MIKLKLHKPVILTVYFFVLTLISLMLIFALVQVRPIFASTHHHQMIASMGIEGLPFELQHCNFLNTNSAFGRVNFNVVSHYSQEELQALILHQTPYHLRSRLKKVLPQTLSIAEKYQVDPFWILSVMWTEGHFRLNIKSEAGALGPMQLMPDTFNLILSSGMFASSPSINTAKEMPAVIVVPYRPIHNVHTHATARHTEDRDHKKHRQVRSIHNPDFNIEMGVVYLKYLVNFFGGDFRLATVAYNQGPFWVKRQGSRAFLPRIQRHHRYLVSVERHYHALTQRILQEYVWAF